MKKLIISAICMALFPTFEAFSEEKNQQKAADSTRTKIVENDTKEEKNILSVKDENWL